MRKNVYLRPYDPYSEGCKELAHELGVRRLRYKNSQFEPSAGATLINWGCSEFPPEYKVCRVVNPPDKVKVTTNKLSFFRLMKDTRTVPWTADVTKISDWLQEGSVVCARTLLRASGGEGLYLFDGCDTIPGAHLYTRYVKKKDEFRVHIVDGKVILIQRKALKKDFEGDVDHRIRNLAHGYIFVRQEVVCPPDVEEQALLSFKESSLDFGAVDVLWNEKAQKAYVLEINSAPGLEGSTVRDYADAFKKLLAT